MTNGSGKTARAFPPNYTSAPLPLLIEDVLQIDSSIGFNVVRSMFGQHFKSVMIHGISQPVNGSLKGEKMCKNYIVDDGTGAIRVKFNHGTHQKGKNSESEIHLSHSFRPNNHRLILQICCVKSKSFVATALLRKEKVLFAPTKNRCRRNRKSASKFYAT